MGKIYLIRHGEVQLNAETVYVGRADIPLNEKGLSQAAKTAEEIERRGISAVYTSVLSRAAQTGQAIADRVGLSINELTDLREFDYGDWEGVSEKKVPLLFPEVFVEWQKSPLNVRVPGGEMISELADRAFPAFLEIAKTHFDEDAAVVSHKTVNRVLICCLLGVDPSIYRRIGQSNACINTINCLGENDFIVESVNETGHLNG